MVLLKNAILRKMLPRNSVDGSSNCSDIKTKFSSNPEGFFTRIKEASCFDDLRFAKNHFSLCVAVLASFLLVHVINVVGTGTSPKMFRINARRIVAGVKDAKIIRNSGIGYLKGKPVRSDTFPFCHQASVTETVRLCCPNPAVISFLDMFPKSFEWISLSGGRTRHGAKISFVAWKKSGNCFTTGRTNETTSWLPIFHEAKFISNSTQGKLWFC